MEPTTFTDMLKQFGPYGICLFIMASGLVYLIRWLREDRKQTDMAHAGIRSEFLVALKDQRTEHASSLKQITTDFKESISEHGRRIDNLGAKVDALDDHVQELRMR